MAMAILRIQHGHIWNFFSYRTLIANVYVTVFRNRFSPDLVCCRSCSIYCALVILVRQPAPQALSYRTPSLHHQRRHYPCSDNGQRYRRRSAESVPDAESLPVIEHAEMVSYSSMMSSLPFSFYLEKFYSIEGVAATVRHSTHLN